jgi:hypothetical protein
MIYCKHIQRFHGPVSPLWRRKKNLKRREYGPVLRVCGGILTDVSISNLMTYCKFSIQRFHGPVVSPLWRQGHSHFHRKASLLTSATIWFSLLSLQASWPTPKTSKWSFICYAGPSWLKNNENKSCLYKVVSICHSHSHTALWYTLWCTRKHFAALLFHTHV